MGDVVKLFEYHQGTRLERQARSMSVPVRRSDIKVHHLADGSKTATCGAWILLRQWPEGRRQLIEMDAPHLMLLYAMEALDKAFGDA